MTDNRSPPPSVRKPDRGPSFSGVGSVRVARPKEEEGTHMHAEMDWAGSFVTMLPIPVCLIDKKGFVHQTNEEFNDLLKIPVENGLCPYAGRFFKCPSFRSSLELLVDSEIVLVIPLKIEWFSTVLVSQEANEHYEWSLSGCKKSSAAVLTGR